MTRRLDLLFLPPLKHVGPPIALIYIKSRFIDPIKEQYAKGRIFLTGRCDSIEELEANIDLIKKDLEIIRKKAKQKFAKQNKS